MKRLALRCTSGSNQYDPTTDEHGWTRIRESPSSSVLIRVHPWLKKSSRAATISGDTDRLAVCATNTTEALNRCGHGCPRSFLNPVLAIVHSDFRLSFAPGICYRHHQ